MATQTQNTSTHKFHPITSGWASIIIQIIIVVFYGAYATFNINQNKAQIVAIETERLPVRVEVLETKLAFYDRIISKIDRMSDDVQEVKVQIKDIQTRK